jgi:hypothetical protein
MRKIAKLKMLTITLSSPILVLAIWYLESYISQKKLEQKTQTQPATNSSPKKHLQKKSTLQTLLQLTNSNKNDGSTCSEKSVRKIWMAPYRQFPETPAEGNSRGLGDYEYLNIFTAEHCISFYTNYGAFKNSPADQVYNNASKDGLQSELALAKKLGFDWFILDLEKVWLSSSQIYDACNKSNHCQLANDNYAVLYIGKQGAPNKLINSLRTATRRLNSNPASILREIVSPISSEWSSVHTQDNGTAVEWSKSSNNFTRLGGRNLAMLPINLDILLTPAPAIRNLSIRLHCASSSGLINITTSKPISISAPLRSCQPHTLEVLNFNITNHYSSSERSIHKASLLGASERQASIFSLTAGESKNN